MGSEGEDEVDPVGRVPSSSAVVVVVSMIA